MKHDLYRERERETTVSAQTEEMWIYRSKRCAVILDDEGKAVPRKQSRSRNVRGHENDIGLTHELVSARITMETERGGRGRGEENYTKAHISLSQASEVDSGGGS